MIEFYERDFYELKGSDLQDILSVKSKLQLSSCAAIAKAQALRAGAPQQEKPLQ